MTKVFVQPFMCKFYLTIDDAPSPDTSNKIKVLKDFDITALWFCLGKNLELHPDAAIELIKNGHIIGNHSYNHPFFSKINLDQAKEEITKTEVIIDNLYSTARTYRPAKLFRFPYGDRGTEKQHKNFTQFLKKLGFKNGPFPLIQYQGQYRNNPQDLDWLWSYDIQEWAINDEKTTLNFEQTLHNLDGYLKSYDRRKSQIILTHDHADTAQYFPQFIAKFSNAKIRFTIPKFH